jgi:hypothetical protein
MDVQKINEIAKTAGQCQASLAVIQIELLAQIVNTNTRILQTLESMEKGGQLELPLTKTRNAEIEKGFASPMVESAPAPIAAPKVVAPKKAPAPKAAPVVEEKPKATAVKILSKEEVLTALQNFIAEHPEGDDVAIEALTRILNELGGYEEFPQVPAEEYPALLEAINQE